MFGLTCVGRVLYENSDYAGHSGVLLILGNLRLMDCYICKDFNILRDIMALLSRHYK